MRREDEDEDTGRAATLGDAISILEDVEKYRNLRRSVSSAVFFGTAALSVYVFFPIYHLVTWVGINEQLALFVATMSWIMIFPVWALFFLLVMSLLDTMGIKDLRSVVRHRLSELTLSQAQLAKLRDVLASRDWRHGRVLEGAIADLTNEHSDPRR